MTEMTRADATPSPSLFFETANAYQRTAALKAAIELDLFTAIGEGARTVEAIAARCDASGRGVRILGDSLAILGFLVKSRDGYRLTDDSAMWLDRRSPAYLGSAVEFLNSPHAMEGFQDLTSTVRRGTRSRATSALAPDHPVWVRFARGMAPMARQSSEQLAELVGAAAGERWKVLDIAAGHGLFGIAIARRNPHAEIVAVDWPSVLAVATEHAAAAGVAGRHRTLAGSAFDVDYGSGYDLALVTNFLHHFDPADCTTLLRKVHRALGAGGRAAILEFVPNDDRISPPFAALFSLTMLASTPAGDAYTFRELEAFCRDAGFSRVELHPLPPTFQHVVVAEA